MMPATFRLAGMLRRAGLPLFLLLGGCATSMHPLAMNIPATGQALSGALSIGSGPRDVTLTADDGRLACNGVSLIEYATLGCSVSGGLRLQCTDGREVTGNWKMEDCESGQGRGADDRGNAVTFSIGPQSADVPLGAAPVTAPAPRNRAADEAHGSTHLFRFGGGYAVAFGALRDAAAVFTDPETGLAILKVDDGDAQMVLSAEPLRTGEEAYAILLGRVERIRVAGEEGDWKIAGNVSLPPGLPVMNLAGEVVAVTNGAQLVAAQAVRRYLLVVAPSLADAPGTRTSADALRARITVRGE